MLLQLKDQIRVLVFWLICPKLNLELLANVWFNSWPAVHDIGQGLLFFYQSFLVHLECEKSKDPTFSQLLLGLFVGLRGGAGTCSTVSRRNQSLDSSNESSLIFRMLQSVVWSRIPTERFQSKSNWDMIIKFEIMRHYILLGNKKNRAKKRTITATIKWNWDTVQTNINNSSSYVKNMYNKNTFV